MENQAGIIEPNVRSLSEGLQSVLSGLPFELLTNASRSFETAAHLLAATKSQEAEALMVPLADAVDSVDKGTKHTGNAGSDIVAYMQTLGQEAKIDRPVAPIKEMTVGARTYKYRTPSHIGKIAFGDHYPSRGVRYAAEDDVREYLEGIASLRNYVQNVATLNGRFANVVEVMQQVSMAESESGRMPEIYILDTPDFATALRYAYHKAKPLAGVRGFALDGMVLLCGDKAWAETPAASQYLLRLGLHEVAHDLASGPDKPLVAQNELHYPKNSEGEYGCSWTTRIFFENSISCFDDEKGVLTGRIWDEVRAESFAVQAAGTHAFHRVRLSGLPVCGPEGHSYDYLPPDVAQKHIDGSGRLYVPWQYAQPIQASDGTIRPNASIYTPAVYGLDLLNEAVPGLRADLHESGKDPQAGMRFERGVNSIQPGLYEAISTRNDGDYTHILRMVVTALGLEDSPVRPLRAEQ